MKKKRTDKTLRWWLSNPSLPVGYRSDGSICCDKIYTPEFEGILYHLNKGFGVNYWNCSWLSEYEVFWKTNTLARFHWAAPYVVTIFIYQIRFAADFMAKVLLEKEKGTWPTPWIGLEKKRAHVRCYLSPPKIMAGECIAWKREKKRGLHREKVWGAKGVRLVFCLTSLGPIFAEGRGVNKKTKR